MRAYSNYFAIAPALALAFWLRLLSLLFFSLFFSSLLSLLFSLVFTLLSSLFLLSFISSIHHVGSSVVFLTMHLLALILSNYLRIHVAICLSIVIFPVAPCRGKPLDEKLMIVTRMILLKEEDIG